MKAAAFTWDAATNIGQAAAAAQAGAKIIAGGQSLGPMLNLRIAQPDALISIAHLPDLRSVSETAAHVTIGAGITHAQISDGLAPDIGAEILPRIAENIAYRAIRNRGTIGGSLCHGDPAADWVTTLLCLDATALISDGTTLRAMRLTDGFFAGAFRTCLAATEILQAVRIPKLPAGARFGYYKACRKPGEFAQAMAAVFASPTHRRIVIGALGVAPLVFEAAEATPETIATALAARAPDLENVTRHMQLIAVKRAFAALTP
jgi:carbon-monoxide dehydrogenase medium subunit